jgi:helicase-like protein
MLARSDYAEFIAKKAIRSPERGMARVPMLSDHLFPFQRTCVEHHLRTGTAGCFLDTGLGKTEVQLEWCQRAIEETNAKALILTPLAVAGQTKRRGDKYGYETRVIREQAEARAGINVCNYDRLEKLDASAFGVIALDEASILKSFTGKTTRALIQAFKGCRFKLAATATPAPNDHMELGNYAEFLEIMAANEMLSRFFINDTSTASQQWRLKHHAQTAFWDWMASWSRMAQKPSDLGDSDEGFDLPPFEIIRHRARDTKIDAEFADMFGAPKVSATSLHSVKRQTIAARAERAGEIVSAELAEPWIIWCHTDYEADALKAAIPSAVEVRGSQSADEKEEKLTAFALGQVRHIIGKPSMMGFGLDWSHCARMVFVGQSFSYESWYQAVRRCWRFGQKQKVIVHLVVAEGETDIGRTIDRKAADHAKMKAAMQDAMQRAQGLSSAVKSPYSPNHVTRLAPWISAA